MLAILGFVMIFLIIYLLMQGKMTPMPTFVIIPLVMAVIIIAMSGNPDFTSIFTFIKDGVGKTWSVAVLFIFSIIYFGVMTEVGLFDPMVNFLVKKAGNNPIMVTVASAILATIVHLDGALAATLLVTCPAMLPLYKRLNMRPVVLLVIIGAAMSVMNLVPWGGPVARLGAILNMDVSALWHTLIPLQIVLIVVTITFAAFMGVIEKRRIAAGIAAGTIIPYSEQVIEEKESKESSKADSLKRPKLIWFNALLTITTIGLLCFTKIPLYGAFMIGTALALVVNFPNPKDQTARIKAHAGDALSISAILLSSGVFLGVLKGTGMLDAMAVSIIAIIPDSLGPYLNYILGIFAVPIGMLLGTDSYFFGLVPLAIEVGETYGISATDMAYSMLIGKNYGVLVTPYAATTFLAIGLAGIELKDLLKFCTPILFILSLISMVAAIFLGII